MTNHLKLESITKQFIKDGKTLTAVNNVNIEVGHGEFLTFLGSSGCGKTTTLRMIAGFENPTQGTIYLDGMDITNLPANKRDLGFVFQNYALFPHMTVGKNVAYGLTVRHINQQEIKKRCEEALEMVGLSGTENRYPNQLSGGEQQRVALARALVLRPKLLLMDEPLSNLDAKLRAHMRSEIRRIQKTLGLTCLYVTHDQKEALTMSDRIMVMNKGNVEQIGTPQELYSDPSTAFVADFIGNANLIKGTFHHEEGQDYCQIGNVKLHCRQTKNHSLSQGQSVYLVVRPQRFSIGNGLNVNVTQALFEGDRMSYLGELDTDTTIEFSLPLTENDLALREGQQIQLTTDPKSVVIPA